MFKYNKYFYIILTLVISLTSFVGCGQMSGEKYNKLENDFYNVYDLIVKDFYNEALQGVNGQQISNSLYKKHKDDIKNLSNLYNIKESQIPNNKKDAYKKMNDELINIVSLSVDSQKGENFSNINDKDKNDMITDCKNFISFNKDKVVKLGINQDTQVSSNTKSDLELVDKTTKYENGMTYIIGTVKNNTNKTYSYVSVKINLYDKDDNQVGNTLDSISNLEANGTWKFKCSTSVNFDKYKIVSINGD